MFPASGGGAVLASRFSTVSKCDLSGLCLVLSDQNAEGAIRNKAMKPWVNREKAFSVSIGLLG